MPGQCLRISRVGVNLNLALSQFDSIEPESGLNADGNNLTRSESIAELRHELARSLEAHLVSDVPLGIFLSGGMDSSALVALMSQLNACQPKTFSVVFDEQEFSESEHAARVARKFNTYDPRYFTTYYAIDTINFEPVKSSAVMDTIDAPYLPLVIQEAAGIPLDPSFEEQKNIMLRCKGVFYACKDGAEARRFNRLLIEAGFIKGL